MCIRFSIQCYLLCKNLFEVTFDYYTFHHNSSNFNSSLFVDHKNKCNEPVRAIQDIFHTNLIPFLLKFISTIITLKFIYKSRRNSNNITTKSKDFKFVLTSVTLNVLFFLLNFPLLCFYFILANFSIKIDIDVKDLINNILRIPFYVYFGSLFYSTLIVNSILRKEFFMLLNEIKSFKFLKFK